MKKKYLLFLPLLLIIILIIAWNYRPRPTALDTYLIKTENTTISKNELTVQFLGNTNLLFSDGETSIMTDAFFTRPPAHQVLFGKVSPNKKIIEKCLNKAGVEKLDAIIPVHSHFDHAMDSPMAADITGAKLIGSTSTANIAIGYGLDTAQILVPAFNHVYQIGKFNITFIKSRHWQYPDAEQRRLLLDNKIEKPLITPASIFDYKEGDSYTILIRHDSTRLAIQGSAGFRKGSLSNHFDADILFLAVAGLELMDEEYNDNYQQHLIEPLQPEILVPIHWDDFTTPLKNKLKTTNIIFNKKMGTNLGLAFEEIEKRNLKKGRKIKVLPLWDKVSVNILNK